MDKPRLFIANLATWLQGKNDDDQRSIPTSENSYFRSGLKLVTPHCCVLPLFFVVCQALVESERTKKWQNKIATENLLVKQWGQLKMGDLGWLGKFIPVFSKWRQLLIRISCVNRGLTVTVGREQEKSRLGRILKYIEIGLKPRSFKHCLNRLICYRYIEAVNGNQKDLLVPCCEEQWND